MVDIGGNFMKIIDYYCRIVVETLKEPGNYRDGYNQTILSFAPNIYEEFCIKHKDLIHSTNVMVYGELCVSSSRFWNNSNLEHYFRFNYQDKIKPFDILEDLVIEHLRDHN